MLRLVAKGLLPKVGFMTDPHALSALIKANLPIFGVVAGLYVALFVYRRFKSSIKGSLGEALVNKGTFRRLDQQLYRGFSDLYLPRPDGDGTTQVDHVVVSPFGIFVIETKNYTGWIYGSENQAKWTQTFGSGAKVPFQNPIWQNRLHIKALAQFLKLPEVKFHSVIFFMGGSTFKTELPKYVIEDGLTSYITGHEEVLLGTEEVERVKGALEELVKGTDKRAAKRAHVAGVKKRVRGA